MTSRLNITREHAASTYIGRNTTLQDLLDWLEIIRDDMKAALDVPKSYPQGYVLDGDSSEVLDHAVRDLTRIVGDGG